MTSQLNPAWQRRPASSNRLAKISERFLSDNRESSGGDDLCRVIPFLLDSPEQSWITHDLCQVLTQRGHDSMLCHLDEAQGPAGRALGDALRCQEGGGHYCLLPLTSPATLQVHRLDHVVLLVPANLDGVRTAYQRIKLMASDNTPEIGVVLVGPRDQHAAWRYFRKLAIGSLRYLDIPLLNLGYIPEQATPEYGPADLHRANFLTRISERLIHSRFHAAPDTASVNAGAS